MVAEPSLHKLSKGLLSICSTTSIYTAQGLSAEGAESVSITGMYTAQGLSAEGAESGSITCMYMAQGLSTEGAESSATTGHSGSAQKVLSQTIW